MFDTVTLQYGNQSIILTQNTPVVPATYGGVEISLLKETFEETYPDTINDLFESRLYDDVSGSFDLQIMGPTTSGIAYFVNRISSLFQLIEVNRKNQYGLSVIIKFNNDYAVLSSATISYKDIMSMDTLNKVVVSVAYTRKPIVGRYNEVNLFEFSSNPLILNTDTYTLLSATEQPFFVPSPTNVYAQFHNVSYMFPSGYFLIADQKIRTLSGSAYYHASIAQTTTINDGVRNAFSVYTGAGTGVLRIVPTALGELNTIKSNAASQPGLGFADAFYSPNADVYMTYRTTVSGTLMAIQVSHYGTNGKLSSTAYTDLPHSINPNLIFVGTINTNAPIGLGTTFLTINTTGTISGALLIDRIVFQPKNKYVSKSVFVSKFDNSRESGGDSSISTSGVNTIVFRSNYMVSGESSISPYGRSGYPEFFIGRSTNASSVEGIKIPSYRGNITLLALYSPNKLTGGNSSFIANTTMFSAQFLAVGSTYDTVSGLANWTFRDLTGLNTQVRWHMGYVQSPKVLVLGE